jgi:hypothetical protein
MNQLSTTTQSTVAAGATAYLGLAPHLTTLAMHRYGLDALPPEVAQAAESVLTTLFTGAAMLLVGGFSWLQARLSKAREDLHASAD